MISAGRKHLYFLLLVLIICLTEIFTAAGEEQFEIKRIGNINPYSDNEFRVSAAENGILTISVHDNICVYRTITQHINAGETRIYWDGCGYNREMLYKKTYTVTAELDTETGRHYSISFATPIEYPDQCLQYAMPSCEDMYTDCPEEWFIEYRTVTDGTVCIEILSKEESGNTYSYSLKTTGGKIGRKDFASISGKKKLPQAGKYKVTVFESSKPQQRYEFDLYIHEGKPEKTQVYVTGEIMPERSMTDEEIWEIMMKPSVVIDIDFFKHQDVFENPDETSRSLGTLHGQTQGVKVIEIMDQWALIGAWNHEDGSYIEGWVPYSRLKTEYPRNEYGILIDKEKQTLTVFQKGKKLDTLLISSGRAEKNRLYQETSAGCFLTGYHRVNFSMNGKKYDYVIQYDGGNLLHQTPYDWGQKKKDFTLGRGYLGAKASHACIRIQPEPGEGGLNAFWLFTHIPYHTRVIILDDQEKRLNEKNVLERKKNEDADLASFHTINKTPDQDEKDVIITFGGCLAADGFRENKNKKGNFNSFISGKGYTYPLKNLYSIFAEDDLTCINVCFSNKNKADQKNGNTSIKQMEELLESSSVEALRMLSVSSAEKYRNSESNDIFNRILEREKPLTIYLKNHLFGFTGCNEKEYLNSPEIIDRRINTLKEQKCEIIVFFADWSGDNSADHCIIQEAIARRCIHAGASLVIGDTKGSVQGIDYIEGVPVFYSLGDLMDTGTVSKSKKQQGIILRAVFHFEEEDRNPELTVIPVLPYGNTEKDKNDYCPAVNMDYNDTERIIRTIWQQTPESVMEKMIFYFPEK